MIQRITYLFRQSIKVYLIALLLTGLLTTSIKADEGGQEQDEEEDLAVTADTSGPTGTWYLNGNGFLLTATISGGPPPRAFQGTLINESGRSERLTNISWSASTHRLKFRRNGSGFWQWYRGKVVEGVLVGRFSHSTQSSAQPAQLTAYAFHVTGWNSNYLDQDIVPRVYEVLINQNFRGRLRIDASSDAPSGYAGRLKVYSTVSGGASGEEPEYDLEVTQWDGASLRFIRRDPSWTQVYTGVARGRTISGTFTHSGMSGTFAWNGIRAEVLGYGFSSKSAQDREAWQKRTRRQLYHLMMTGNPRPLTRQVTTLNSNVPLIGSGGLGTNRDDDPANWPRDYQLKELRFDYTLRNPYGSSPIPRRSHGYLALPNIAPPPGDKYPAVLAVNGHGGSAWRMMNSDDNLYWYGDAFARRGFVVLAVDISHRNAGDDVSHGNGPHPPIKAPGFDSDWEQDGERAWDAMRALDYLLSLPYVDSTRVLVTGISMGGEITTIVGALDPRISLSLPTGFSPDLGVMIYNGNHECWRWLNADVREYIDTSDFYALTAPRPLIIETGKIDFTFSRHQPPFAADKQVTRRTRAAYGDDIDNFVHYLHYAAHVYRVGDVNPTCSTCEQGVRTPDVIEPEVLWSLTWQNDGSTSTDGSTLFDYIAFYLGL